MKAVIRGDIIAYQSANNRENRAKLSEIDTQTTNLESEYRSTSCETTLKKIVALRSEYTRLFLRKCRDNLCISGKDSLK